MKQQRQHLLNCVTIVTLVWVFVASSIAVSQAGVMIDALQFEPGNLRYSIFAPLDADETPTPDCSERLTTAWNMFGIASNSVTTNSYSADDISGWPVLFVKANPPIESILSLEERQFVPDPPVLKIPKVPIV